MADYIFNIPGTGCTEGQRIAKYTKASCVITTLSIEAVGEEPSWWTGVSVELDETDSTYGYIVLKVPENESETLGRSQEANIKFKLNETDTTIGIKLCQTNKGSEPPTPTMVKATMIMLDNTRKKLECSDNTQISTSILTGAGVTIEDVKEANFESCITEINGSIFQDKTNLTACTFADDIQIETIPQYFLKGTKIKAINIPPSVKTIGDYAFSDCYDLTSSTFSNGSSLETIGTSAFEGDKMVTMTLPDTVSTIGNKAFCNCKSLTSFSFGNNTTIEEINDETFRSCDLLTGITIPSSVTNLKERSFYHTQSIKSITIPKSVKTIGRKAFQQNYDDSTKSVATSLTALTFESGSVLEEIGESAFEYAVKIKSLRIPNTVKKIGADAFYQLLIVSPTQYVTSLTSLTFDSGSVLEEIGDSAFANSSGLTSLSIPSSVKILGDYAFHNTTSLTSLTFGSNSVLEEIGRTCFSSSAILNVTFPKTLKIIKDEAFHRVNKLSGITFENGAVIESIGSFAFADCHIKGSLVLPEGLKTIGLYAFEGNQDLDVPENSLTSITIPSSVTSLGHGIFHRCYKLKTATIKAVDPPEFIPSTVTTEEWIFQYGAPVICDLEHVYVPSESVNRYKSARGFQNVRDIISAMP